MPKALQDRLQKEEMDKIEIEKGKYAALGKLTDSDRSIIRDMN